MIDTQNNVTRVSQVDIISEHRKIFRLSAFGEGFVSVCYK